MLRDFTITEQSGNKTSSTVSVDATGLPVPAAGDVIELRDGNDVLFWGLCGIPTGPTYRTGHERRIYKIVCSSANALLANRVINAAYQNRTISQIVTALFHEYISAEGISLGAISAIDIMLDVYTAKDYNLQDALGELADMAGATWTIGTDRSFRFVAPLDFPALAAPISAERLLGTDLTLSTKDYKTRTVQIVSGAYDTTSAQTESWQYTDQQSFSLGFPLAQKPAITVNGAQVPPACIGVNGLNDGEAGIAFLFSYNSRLVTYVEQSAYLADGDNVQITYIGRFPIRVTASNDAKIAQIAALTGTSGRREVVQLASNTSSQAAALRLAQSLLMQFEAATSEVRFWLWTDQLAALGLSLGDLSLLTQLTFDLPSLGITGDYVITERTLSPAHADMSAPYGSKLKASFVCKNRNYLQSYGEVLSAIRRDVTALSVRGDDVVINAQAIPERCALTESVTWVYPWTLYPQAALSCGSLFAPMDLGLPAYPV